MVQIVGGGRAEVLACGRVFKQAIWLWGQIYPENMEMSERNELNSGKKSKSNGENALIDETACAEQEVGDKGGHEVHDSADRL